jgi:hypothetical protein
MYELFIEGQKADINDQISVQLTFAIDDVANFASRETSFSKQIVLPGTAANHSIFGHVYEMGSNNPFSPGQPNIGAAFNVAQTSRAELRLNGLLVLRGIFRLTGIIKDGDFVEYEGALFGELSGLMSEISNKKLEDLDFSEYNHDWTHTNISNSWDNTPGSGYFYPLIDYGLYRETAVISGLNDDYEVDTLRPAFYVKEYIDKMFEAAGYTYESEFFDSAYFKKLIVPHNKKQLTNNNPQVLDREADDGFNVTVRNRNAKFPIGDLGLFTASFDSDAFTLGGSTAISATITTTININSYTGFGTPIRILIRKGSTVLKQLTVSALGEHTLSIENVYINVGEVISIRFADLTIGADIEYTGSLKILTTTPIEVFAVYGTPLYVNDSIPKGIFQKDFLSSLVKMFNLYIWEDKENEKKLNIEPYIDYLTANDIDWTYKVARDKPWQISPMGNLNGRIFEYKYKEDNDFYNESYKKKFNQNYADRQFDTGFQFSADRVSTEIIFASSPLIQYDSSDKYVVPIYKKSNELSAEDRMDSNIRILFSKKLSADTWNIKLGINSYPKTAYGYAGHLDDPISPTYDLNFGAPREVYFSITNYPSANLFNRYWSDYIAQIADKDSKILKCHVYLRPLDIAQLDFANPIFIDGVRFRLNKITDYDYTNNELVQVELLKIIE